MTFESVTFSPTRKPIRNTTATASQGAGISSRRGRGGGAPDARLRSSHSIRASRYSRGGYTSGTEAQMLAWLKNASETENDSSTSRSRCSSDSGRRKSKNGAMNSRHRGIQM